jgi:CheY-like chemotaxis protein
MNNVMQRKKCILLIDDDKDLLLLMSGKLRREGFDITISPNAEDLATLLAINHPDLIILDIHMEGVDGGEICQMLKSNPETSGIPVIMFSANDNIATIATECGADSFISKPFDSKILGKVAHDFLDKL